MYKERGHDQINEFRCGAGLKIIGIPKVPEALFKNKRLPLGVKFSPRGGLCILGFILRVEHSTI
jgi:hypothetical protein